MASEFDNLEADALADILATTGEALVLTDADGLETTFTGELAEAAPAVRHGDDGRTYHRTATALAKAAEVPNLAKGQTIRRENETEAWTIETARPIAGGLFWDITLARPEPIERSRRGYRLERT